MTKLILDAQRGTLKPLLADPYSGSSVVQIYTYYGDFTNHYYAIPNPNHKNGTEYGPRKLNDFLLYKQIAA